MGLFLSKLLLQLISPLALCLWLAILSGMLVRWRKRVAAVLVFVSVGILWISSSPLFSSYLCSSLEQQYLPVTVSESPTADAIVVLGGAVGPAEATRLEVDLTEASDRVFHAARLYRAGKAPIVIAAGGGVKCFSSKIPEANAMSVLLQEWGILENMLVLETESLNKYQNAINTKRVLNARGMESILLVISAMHMPRALATFRAAGINAIPSLTDYRVLDQENYTIFDFLPDAGALGGSTRAIKEYLGLVAYRWRGWI